MKNLSLQIRYIGTAYHGWQRQNNALSVSSVIESAIHSITGESVNVTGCGRTDAGVHALNYTANFFTLSSIPASKWPFALNAHLPQDIRVLSAREEDSSFHSVNSCVRKTYQYVFHLSEIEDPFLKDRVFRCKIAPDISKMKSAAQLFAGEHDFYSYHSLGTDIKTTVRTMYHSAVTVDHDIAVLELSASGFLYKMARTIAGTVYYAGIGKISEEQILTSFEIQDRSLAGPVLPGCGLYLKSADYERGTK